jgi:hypothetical protein
MRRLIIRFLISSFIFLAESAKAQSDFETVDSTMEELFDNEQWESLAQFGMQADKDSVDYFTLNFRTGVALYFLKQYAASEHFLSKALVQNNTSQEAGNYYFSSLMEQGLELEADKLKKKYPFISGFNKHRIVESIYAEAGLKIPENEDVFGQIHYYSVGVGSNPFPGVRLWQAGTYLEQGNKADGYKQFEYFISLPAYLNNRWYLLPSFHFAATDYNNQHRDSLPYHHFQPFGKIAINEHGFETRDVSENGRINALHFAIAGIKRFGRLSIEAEPGIQFSEDKSNLNVLSRVRGRRDTLDDQGHLIRSVDFEKSKEIIRDTSNRSSIGQFGLALTYRIPFLRDKVSLRVSSYYVSDGDINDVDFFAYSLVRLHKKAWIHLSYLYKNDLPLSLNYVGQYYNSISPIRNRSVFTIQLFPLKPLTPYLTWQFEEQVDLSSQKIINYQGIYITVKYNL